MNLKIFLPSLIVFLLLSGCSTTTFAQPADSINQQPTALAQSLAASATRAVAGEGQPTSAYTRFAAPTLTYPIVDTGQGKCFDDRAEITCPQTGTDFSGQDAQYTGNAPTYQLSVDGLTVQDTVTGLTWQRSPDTNADGSLDKSDKLTWTRAQALPAKLNAANYGGYRDWRLPTIKELYSLIDFGGTDPSGAQGEVTLTPFIDTTYFQFAYGEAKSAERTIDSQYASSTLYVYQSSRVEDQLFGVNFADGRIKGYGLRLPGGAEKTFFVICVRGNNQYGLNNFNDNGDQTISDQATGLTWAKTDSGTAMNWQDALAWVQAQNAANYLGHSDWRLPNAKELQSIVDYSRSPDTTNSAAIDPLFVSTQITNEAGQTDFPASWSGTTHASSNGSGGAGVYIAFGRAMGYMNNAWMDVHGAGAQRSDPKSGNPAEFPTGRGPQGDAIRILNYLRLVRGGDVTATPAGDPNATRPAMMVQSTGVEQNQPGGAPGQDGQPLMGGAPPPEAIAACTGLNAGDSCQFTTPNGRAVSGTCALIQQQPACLPAGAPPLAGQP